MNYWLLSPPKTPCKILIENEKVILENELVKRVINVNKGTESYCNLSTNEELILSVTNDITFEIDNIKYNLYQDFNFVSATQTAVIKNFDTPKKSYSTENVQCFGKGVDIKYNNDNFILTIHYEIYDTLPVIAKLVAITPINSDVTINKFTLEKLNIENNNSIYGETNYNGGDSLNNNRQLSVNHRDNIFEIAFDVGPEAIIKRNDTFESMVGYELLHTAKYYEQRMIEVKQMYKNLCPWVLHSPLIFHVTTDNSRKIKGTIDDVKSVGFDMLIQSFGSKVNVESTNKRYIARHKKLYDYAHNNGIEIGGYTLAIVKNYKPVMGDECNVLADPEGKVIRCLSTEWSVKYWNNIINFYKQTGADAIEIDGPYHFYQCKGGKTHLHKGTDDSRYLQWKMTTVDTFKRFKNLGVYINTPDWMFFNGVNKACIGYEEIAFSQPRQEQLISSRIYNYKGTFNKIPSMAWSFLPIDVYHGGGKSACFSPLSKNFKDYDWAIFQHMISGVLPCFRGKKLFDNAEVQQMVKKWTDFYKKYKNVINGITVHFLPPIMDKNNHQRTVDIDAILNVRPYGEIRGILGLFNQTDKKIVKTIKIPLFYTGLTDCDKIPQPKKGASIIDVKNPIYGEYPPPYPVEKNDEVIELAKVSGYSATQVFEREKIESTTAFSTDKKVIFAKEDLEITVHTIDSNGDAKLTVSMEPMTYQWFTIRKAD